MGTPKRVADQLQQWFEEEGADGFNIMSPWLPGGLDDFIELALPELRRRGLVRSEYQGSTLREHLGLHRPAHPAAAARGARAAA
ncbi:nitrilotriacetate monooxygenase component A domain protein [Bordetella hinzii L60]|nr:nitrilotriacetate monooxygenase component A domain protein [Bordetella hinzii L60]